MLTSKRVRKALPGKSGKSRRRVRELDRPRTLRDSCHELPFHGAHRFETVFRNAQDIILVVNSVNNRILLANDAVQLYLGHSPGFLEGMYFTDLFSSQDDMVSRDGLERRHLGFDAVFRDQGFLHKDGHEVLMDITATLIPWDYREAILITIRGTEERREAERLREELIAELQLRLTQVKQLSGFLPICSHCKRIRDGEGEWNEASAFILDHSEAEFTHSICPTCISDHYFEIGVDLKDTSERDLK